MYALAAAIDSVRGLQKGFSSLAANTRALAVHVREFRERAGVALAKAPDEQPAPSIVDSADDLAAKRAARRQGRQPA